MTQNIDQNIQQLKQRIRALQSLAGTLVVIAGETIVTVQRADRDKQKRMLRRRHLMSVPEERARRYPDQV